MTRRVVISGGPGSGKTTLIEMFRARGYPIAPEAGRAILKHQHAIGGSAQHHLDAALYAELMLSWEMRSYDAMAAETGTVFFDRSIAELTGYFPLIGKPLPPHFAEAARRFRYHHDVFVAPPWPQIYVNDAERKQDFAEAIRSHEALVTAYRDTGYHLVELPKASPGTRADFILAALGADVT